MNTGQLYHEGQLYSNTLFQTIGHNKLYIICMYPLTLHSPFDMHEATISASHMHRHSLQLLRDHLVEGARALDIGAVSGHFTVCRGIDVEEGSYAVGMEHIMEINDQASLTSRKTMEICLNLTE